MNSASRASVAPSAVSERPGRLSVGIVGAGRAGAAFAAALDRAGHRVVAATTASHSFPLLEAFEGLPRLAAADVAAMSELLVLTVPDDTLPGLVHGLAVTGALRPGQIVVHAAGRYGLEVLAPATEAGALPIALHPAMTFSGTEADLARLADAVIAVTAPPEFRVVGEALAIELGGEPVFIPDELRVRWHTALAHGANHLVTLVGQCVDLLVSAGVEHPEHVLRPLLSAALENALREGDAALTGPVVRGDVGTVAAHLRELAGSSALESYLALAGATLTRATKAGRLPSVAATAVREVLDGPR